jgi:sugar/nucleoside kinase (ribokinase family)
MSPLDVVVSGLVFQDLVLGLPTPPRPGTEVWATDSLESPGGIANFAVALSRLGLRTGLAAAFGADDPGDRLWDRLADGEGIDLTLSRKLAGWQTPLTVALAYDNDRALVTRGTPPLLSADELITAPPAARAVAAHIGPGRTSGWRRRRRPVAWCSPTSAGTRRSSGTHRCSASSSTATCSSRTPVRR